MSHDPHSEQPSRIEICECDHSTCPHKGRSIPAHDHGDVWTSPALCMACLFGCTDDDDD